MFFKLLSEAFKVKQVRSKILFTIFIVFVFRIGTSGKRGRVEALFSTNKLIIKPRKFKAHVEFNKDVSLAETIGEVVRGILYTYYDLIDDEDHVY